MTTRKEEIWPRYKDQPIGFCTEDWPVVATTTASVDDATNLHLRCSMDVLRHADGRVMVRGVLVKVFNEKVTVYSDIVGPYGGQEYTKYAIELLATNFKCLMDSFASYIAERTATELFNELEPVCV